MRTRIFPTVLILIIWCACADPEKPTNDSLVGKWKLIETYDGYFHGGSFTWNKVPANYSEIIEFTVDNQYFENVDSPDVQRHCTGNYRILSDTLVELESSCQTVLVRLKISERTPTSLIIDQQVIEGVIRNKYSATK